MTTPFTRYGLRELILVPSVLLLAALACWRIWPDASPWPQLAAALGILAVLAFFRDPHRTVPPNSSDVLLAPADGQVTDIIQVREDEFLRDQVWRIGIFLSVANVHINRSPCAGQVAYVQQHPGKCYNALRSQAASLHNRSASVGLKCLDHPAGNLLVKQITGAIARRIVTAVSPGDRLAAGQRFGMIKFGSRTELYFHCPSESQIIVKKGDKVRAGVTVLVDYSAGRALGRDGVNDA